MIFVDLGASLTPEQRERLAKCRKWTIGPPVYFAIRTGRTDIDKTLLPDPWDPHRVEVVVDRLLPGNWVVGHEAGDGELMRPVGAPAELYAIPAEDLPGYRVDLPTKPIDSGAG